MSAGNIIKPFWSWNDKLEKEELLRQIDVMKENGIDGFFMHARSGLVTEYLSDEWFELIEACIIRAEELDMEAWAYDENGWPSGFADGKVPQIGFDFQQKTIDIKVIEDVSVLPERVLGFYQIKEGSGFKVLTDAKVGAVAIYCKVNEYYTDLMNGNAVDYFIKLRPYIYFKGVCCSELPRELDCTYLDYLAVKLVAGYIGNNILVRTRLVPFKVQYDIRHVLYPSLKNFLIHYIWNVSLLQVCFDKN